MIGIYYVWAHLASSDKPVLAGAARPVYNAENNEHMAIFRYARQYIERPDAISLDPVNLPILQNDPDHMFETDRQENLQMFGAIRDAAPDAWGQIRMARAAKLEFGDTKELDINDYILASGEDRLGFLAFSLENDAPRIIAPWAKKRDMENSKSYIDLDASLSFFKEIDNIVLSEEESRRLLIYGSSLGGARPKTTILYNGQFWLAKAARKDDMHNKERAELAAMWLAEKAGINVPEAQVITIMDRPIYLVKRFDRDVVNGKIKRYPVVSALSLMGFNENVMEWKNRATYMRLAGYLEHRSDKKELFRRVLFNLIVANTDDHPKNHAILWRPQVGWLLSPLYDVEPAPLYGSTRHLAMPLGEMGDEGNIENLLSKASDFGLTRSQAVAEISAMLDTLDKNWAEVFQRAGLSSKEIQEYGYTMNLIKNFRNDVANIAVNHEIDDHDDNAAIGNQNDETALCSQGKEHCANPHHDRRPTKMTNSQYKKCSYCRNRDKPKRPK